MAKGKGQRAKGKGEGRGESREKVGESKSVGSIDELYQLPLSEFTAGRNSLATRLRKSGKAGDSDEVRSLVKPSIPAWAVNQVYWKHRAVFDRLLSAGDRLRKAQASTLAGKSADVRGALDAVREALSEPIPSLDQGLLAQLAGPVVTLFVQLAVLAGEQPSSADAVSPDS